MAIEKQGGRQWPLTAKVSFTYADIDGEAIEVADLPGGAVVTGGYVVIVNAWDSATSATLDVGDKTTATKYVTGVDAKAAGGTALVPAGAPFDVKDALTVTVTNVGTPTVGDGYVVLQYIIDGRSNEVQPELGRY